MRFIKSIWVKVYLVFNEIILTGLEQLPIDYRDMVINYIATNFNENIFDKTSGNKDELALVKEVLKKHAVSCSEDDFKLLENRIVSYIDPKIKKWYKSRIEFNKIKENGITVYWSFCGDLQISLLPFLPQDRLCPKTKDLLVVLNRRFQNVQVRYSHFKGHSGSVSSPISGKKLGNAQWLQILNSKKLYKKKCSRWIEVKGGFIESSIEEFSISFREAVSSEPERFINLLLGCDLCINDIYIDSLFSGVAFSNHLNKVSTQLLEKLILKYRYNYESFRASYICNIIEEKDNADWSYDIIEILNDIARNHSNPDNQKLNATSDKNKEMRTFQTLQSNALNCVRGTAARAIGHLLWNNKEQYVQFKDTVEKLCNDINPAVRLANLYALCPIYNIDREWATEKILYTFETDYMMAGYDGSRQLFFLMYHEFRERVLEIILKCYFSDDKDLIKLGANSLAEMYLQNREFEEEITDVKSMNETQAKSILEMLLLYFNKEEYNDHVKSLIKNFKSSDFDLEFPISRIFYDNMIDLERDKEFLIEIMKSDMSRRTIHALVHYLEENSKSIIEYKDVILSMSYTLIEKHEKNSSDCWGIDDELSKLIMGLYDETSQLTGEKLKHVSEECLNIWDLMFEKRIGSARLLSQQILDR